MAHEPGKTCQDCRFAIIKALHQHGAAALLEWMADEMAKERPNYRNHDFFREKRLRNVQRLRDVAARINA